MQFRAPGDDWYAGRATRYRITLRGARGGTFTAKAPGDAGRSESIALPFAARRVTVSAEDNAGNRGTPLATSKPCASRRRFSIRLKRVPRRLRRVVRAQVFVNGKRVRVVRGRRLESRVDLRGLPKGTFRVRIVQRTSRGRTVRSTRTYWTCVPKRRARR